jgi:hypothetical protein
MSPRKRAETTSVEQNSQHVSVETSGRTENDNLDILLETLILTKSYPKRERLYSSEDFSDDLTLDRTIKTLPSLPSPSSREATNENVECRSLDGIEDRHASKKKSEKRRIPKPPKGYAAQLQIPISPNDRPQRLKVHCIPVSVPSSAPETDSANARPIPTKRKKREVLSEDHSSRSLDDLDVQYFRVPSTNSAA